MPPKRLGRSWPPPCVSERNSKRNQRFPRGPGCTACVLTRSCIAPQHVADTGRGGCARSGRGGRAARASRRAPLRRALALVAGPHRGGDSEPTVLGPGAGCAESATAAWRRSPARVPRLRTAGARNSRWASRLRRQRRSAAVSAAKAGPTAGGDATARVPSESLCAAGCSRLQRRGSGAAPNVAVCGTATDASAARRSQVTAAALSQLRCARRTTSDALHQPLQPALTRRTIQAVPLQPRAAAGRWRHVRCGVVARWGAQTQHGHQAQRRSGRGAASASLARLGGSPARRR